MTKEWRARLYGWSAMVVVSLLTAGLVVAEPALSLRQPYAGLEERPIKALSPERTRDLLEGEGLGYALAAELNHYPGPAHVLELSVPLGLTPDQIGAVQRVYDAMKAEARALGSQLIELERQLDDAFKSGDVTSVLLERLIAESAAVEGRLRFAHLAAHLEVTSLLTETQVAQYDHMRGYAHDAGAAPHHPHHHGGH